MSKHKVEITGFETVRYKRTMEMDDKELNEWKRFVKTIAKMESIACSDLFDAYRDIDEGMGINKWDLEISINEKDCSKELLGE